MIRKNFPLLVVAFVLVCGYIAPDQFADLVGAMLVFAVVGGALWAMRPGSR